MNIDEVRSLLKRLCKEAGSMRAWSRANGLTAPYVSDVLRAQRSPGPRLLKALGLEKVETVTVTYRKALKNPSGNPDRNRSPEGEK